MTDILVPVFKVLVKTLTYLDHVSLGEEDVLRFEVAMENSLCVYVPYRHRYLHVPLKGSCGWRGGNR